ncbi:MAG: helicase [Candidatus Abyssobacteria bacterium SURF_5]|uniref:Helicase n=1 Tax=Abyssobacteria bacterium (strain SURF_5) TaxID=2093360 RepID=A0A3A4NS68_ABYX5|nr:MAG: helicase [Candidatus Abyssubacteria bacterium SURF_5]
MLSAKRLIAQNAITALRTEIESAGGNEVFFIGATNEKRMVVKVIPLAHGNQDAVPAITQHARPGDVVIHNHPGGGLTPSSADISIASNLGQAGVGFYIINNSATKVYEVVAAFAREKLELLQEDSLADMLRPGGPIARKLKNYEHRQQQIEMMRAVADAFNRNGIAAIEAGTGTGKTFAYLIPAICWAVRNKERVVLSTNTINLQEQLMRKDIPALLSALNIECKAALVKGRGNYICLRKAAMLEREFDLLAAADERETLQHILAWSKQTRDGSRSDLNFVPKADLWDKVNSESDSCARVNCAHFADCFVNRARREAACADLLVVNHHLLFADLSVRNATQSYSDMAILPGYRRVILDEAHNIEDSATSYFGSHITRLGLLRLLGRIHHAQSRRQEGGLISALRAKLMRAPAGKERVEDLILNIQEEIIPRKNDLEHYINGAFDTLLEFLHNYNLTQRADGELKMRIGTSLRDNERWSHDCLPAVEKLLSELRVFVSRLALVLKKLEEIEREKGSDTDFSDDRIEINAIANRIDSAASTVEDVIFGEGIDHVRWIEAQVRAKNPAVRLYSVPLDVGPALAEQVYVCFPTVVLTSATLTVEGRFDFLFSRIGLDKIDEERIRFLSLPSPFNFAEQAVLGIPTDVPNPGDSGFRDVLVSTIFRCLSITQGRAFLLFTSFSMLGWAYRELAPRLEQELGVNALRQGDDNRTALLERFRRDTTSVLFATLSFWEGVDVEGESLECVVLAKLPFRVPDDPIVQARAEDIERRGGNPFIEFSVPLAVIKFKQGFGRLIRNRTDHGAVLILDKRVAAKYYGRIFLNSLPPCRVVRGTCDEVFEEFQTLFTMLRREQIVSDVAETEKGD